MRMPDRRAAGRLLAPAVARQDLDDPVIVGIGPGGAVVGAELARTLGSPLDMIDLTELDTGDALHPSRPFGALSRDGHLLIRPDNLVNIPAATTALRAAARRTRQIRRRLAATPAGPGSVPKAWRTVILVDDGTSPREVITAALDLVRAGRPSRVLLAVAAAPQETIDELAAVAGDVIVGSVVPWTEWFHLHGRIYDDDTRPSEEQVGQLLQR